MQPVIFSLCLDSFMCFGPCHQITKERKSQDSASLMIFRHLPLLPGTVEMCCGEWRWFDCSLNACLNVV